MPSPWASEIVDDGDDADRPAHNARDDVHQFEGGNRVRKDDDECDRKEHGRGPDRPHLGGLAGPDSETGPDDEERRPEGHHELLAEDRHVGGFRAGREQQQMIGEDCDQNGETACDEPTRYTPPSARLQPILNAPAQEGRRGQAQSHRDPRDRDEVHRIRDRRIHQADRSDSESQDDDEQHNEQPSRRREGPRVVQERKERQQNGADDEQRGEQIDELDFRPGRDPRSLRRNDRGQGSRRFPRMRGTDWPPTRTTLGFPPSVSTLTSMRLAWWISIPCSITNVGAGSWPREARYAPHPPAALPVAGSSIPRPGAKLRAWTAAPGVSPPRAKA